MFEHGSSGVIGECSKAPKCTRGRFLRPPLLPHAGTWWVGVPELTEGSPGLRGARAIEACHPGTQTPTWKEKVRPGVGKKW